MSKPVLKKSERIRSLARMPRAHCKRGLDRMVISVTKRKNRHRKDAVRSEKSLNAHTKTQSTMQGACAITATT